MTPEHEALCRRLEEMAALQRGFPSKPRPSMPELDDAMCEAAALIRQLAATKAGHFHEAIKGIEAQIVPSHQAGGDAVEAANYAFRCAADILRAAAPLTEGMVVPSKIYWLAKALLSELDAVKGAPWLTGALGVSNAMTRLNTALTAAQKEG